MSDGWFSKLLESVGGSIKDVDPTAILAAGIGALVDNSPNIEKAGYQGGIPDYTASRSQLPNTTPPTPGASGQRYFTDTTYTKQPDVNLAQGGPVSADMIRQTLAQRGQAQGIAGVPPSYAKGRYVAGETDGMADDVPAKIDGVQEAALSGGEYVIPADVVSHLGNGNSTAGAKVLDGFLAKVRKTRTGNDKQGKEIDPQKLLPGSK